MRRDLALALRLVRGAGRRELLRLGLMTGGVALAVLAALVGTAAPRATANAHDVEVARAPVLGVGPGAPGALRLDPTEPVLGDRPWTLVRVRGAAPGSPTPPGLDSWPSPGSTLVSPALRELAAHDPGTASALGTLAPGVIGRAGLTGPDELLGYAVTAQGSPGEAGPGGASTAEPAVVGFGNPAAAVDGGSALPLLIEVAVLVLTPTVLFLATALRLSAASRRRRSFALGLAGMSPRRISRTYAVEMSAVTVAGLVVGIGGFQVLQGRLGSSGLVGVRWWPEQGHLGRPAAVLVSLVAVTAVAALAARSMRVVSSRSRSQTAAVRPGRIAAVAALVLGLPGAGFLAVAVVDGWLRPSTRWATDGYAAAVAAAVIAGVAAVVLGVPGLVARLGDAAAGHSGPGLALGLRGAAYRVSSGRRLVAFVASAVMLAGLGTGFVASLRVGAFGDPDEARISFDLAQVGGVEALPPGPFTIETALPGTAGRYSVVIGDCPAVERQAASVFTRPAGCTDSVQRGGGGIGGASAHSIRIGRREVPVPPTAPISDVTWDLKFPLRAAAPWLRDLTGAGVTYWVSRDDGSYDRVLGQLLHRFPGIRVEAGLKDPEQYAAYRQQVGTVRAAGLLGVVLSVLAFLMAALESRWERTRSRAALAAIGVPQRVLRTANLVELTFPVLVAAVPAAAVGVAGGWGVLSFRGTAGMFSPDVVVATLAGAVSSIAIAAATGWTTGAATFRREDLADP